ncbi:MAG: hypothetical protein QOE86_2960 [Solirubrobacteraceae bacterium]|jgi:hypothetical protein|nr:hypothetical protein [Solirubrobacteraceae bacterium]
MGSIRELAHPPAHRSPVIASGAVLLVVGVALEQVRISPGAGVQLLVPALLAAVLLWLALRIRLEGGRPPASVSVLAVSGLLVLYVALLRLADLLGADFSGSTFPAGAFAWTGVVEAGAAAYVAARRTSAVAALIAAIAGGVALLSAWDWIFAPGSVTPYRWLLLLVALVCGLASLPLRGESLRHAQQMVNTAGLAILAIPVLQIVTGGLFFGAPLPTFWELVVLAAGLGLIAYAAADRAPGPAYLGVANLAAFVGFEIVGADATLRWWPLLLLLAGAAVMLIGLRPRRPLPPEPPAYGKDDLPLAARTGDVTVRVRRD